MLQLRRFHQFWFIDKEKKISSMIGISRTMKYGNETRFPTQDHNDIQKTKITLCMDSSSLRAVCVFGTLSVPGVNISRSRTMPLFA